MSFQRSCYLLSVAAVTWSQAEEKCRTHGGHLVVLNSVEELVRFSLHQFGSIYCKCVKRLKSNMLLLFYFEDYISKIVEIQHNYWIGLVERENEGHWSWVDGTDFNSTPT